MIRHHDGSSSMNRHLCRTRCAGRSLMPAAPRRATISTVTVIRAVKPTQTVRATVAAVLLPRSRRVRRRRTAVRDCLALSASSGPPAAVADPPDCQAVPAAGRPPAAGAGRTALSADAAAASRQMIVRSSEAMQPLQSSTDHDDAFHE